MTLFVSWKYQPYKYNHGHGEYDSEFIKDGPEETRTGSIQGYVVQENVVKAVVLWKTELLAIPIDELEL